MQWLMIKYLVIVWAAIAGHAMGLYPMWLLLPTVAWCCLLHTVNCHDLNHAREPPPMLVRWTGYGLFCAGFLPLASTWIDAAHQHIKVHHLKTKGPLDHHDDPHSRMGRMTIPKMVLTCFLMPGHVSLEDILFHQILKNPPFWTDRILTNLAHWLQLAVLYRVGPFFPVLLAGHVGMFSLWILFSGFLHQDDFFRLLVNVDPSGMRVIPFVESIMKCVSPNAWLEIKWHDLHHSHALAQRTFGHAMARGTSYEQIDSACANLVDEGLFLDNSGKPFSPLAKVGHVPGSRKAFLEAAAKNEC